MASGLVGAPFSIYDTVTGQVDPTQGQTRQNSARKKQMQGINTVGDWAFTGEGPSAAQEMVDRNRSQNAARQVGMAKSMGGDPALANRMANEGITKGNAEATYQGTMLRSQEQQQAMDNYLRSIGQARGQDIDVYGTEQAGRQQNASNKMGFWNNAINKASSAIGLGF